MKPYQIQVEVTTKYSIEIHTNDEADATAQAEDMDLDAIEAAGDFVELVRVEVANVEAMESEDDEDAQFGEAEPNAETVAAENTDNIAMDVGTDNDVEETEDVEPTKS